LVTDPPYGLGREPTEEELDRYLSGEGGLDLGDFMGKNWEIPSVAVWRECFRLLKPGRLLLSFGGTRTFDLISLGIQAAGFMKLGELLWVHGQGFAKGGDISKKIDKAKGVVPKVIGPDPEAKRRNKKTPRFNGQDYNNGQVYQGATEIPLTEPMSEEGQLWKGWGSQLKPAWEPILVFCKGESERTIDFTDPFFYCAKAAKSETTLKGEIENDHPTKKPLKLMRHLVSLASRPGELVLDPYLGSGTTAEACIHERVEYIGIEKYAPFHEIASKRTCIVQAEVNSFRGQQEVFALSQDLNDDDEPITP
jgi:site-specific DNA-methyltransferase (adenine-specific)